MPPDPVDTAELLEARCGVPDCKPCEALIRACVELDAERAAHALTKEQLAESEQQLRLAEVARDASRDTYDAEVAAHAETKRELEHERGLKEISDGQFREALAEVREELGQEKQRLESAEAALRMYLNTTLPFPADAHFARFGGKHE